MLKVHENFSRFGFCGDYTIGLIDATHILIHLVHENDYARLFLKPLWYIDTPIAPVWVSFPLLPIHFRAKSSLYAITKAIGLPLRIDEATSDLRRPSDARVRVEVNLDYDLPDRVWIEREKIGGYWQQVIYDQKPEFYYKCRHFGYLEVQCKLGIRSAPPPVVEPIPKLVIPAKDKDKGKAIQGEPRQRWTPVHREQKRQQASTSGAHVSQADPPTVAQSIASIVATALVNPPIVQSVAPDTIAPSSAITPALALSQPVINIDSDYTDPLVHDMSRRTHDSEAIDTVVRQLPGPTPGRIGNPASSSPLVCQQNIEASIPSVESDQSDTEATSQIEVHQQGVFRRSSVEDLVGMAGRSEDDDFV
ncbi:uncharacterized protein LOC111375197 [Olea europaea var. sylvestris]|uniref:uncharacterized protein LOC111375197 n=1 Tax=Olea europaea var. sylvestris TaxID=158386 RepID=UPI000C1D82D9|nr:uncharacterized protein LOC111375197 [Olea europaea var. sylvestris]